jgi:hypothetical protein
MVMHDRPLPGCPHLPRRARTLRFRPPGSGWSRRALRPLPRVAWWPAHGTRPALACCGCHPAGSSGAAACGGAPARTSARLRRLPAQQATPSRRLGGPLGSLARLLDARRPGTHTERPARGLGKRSDGSMEIACSGGRGRTGTALACLAIIDGLPPEQAVAFVRQHYDPHAVETPWQKRYAAHFRITRRGG